MATTPQPYPFSMNAPIPSGPILRPVPEPIFDSEFLVPGILDMKFFHRSLGQSFWYQQSAYAKNVQDTNMSQSGMLPNPCEFSLIGFSFNLDSRVSREQRANVYHRASLEIRLNNWFLCNPIPLHLMPATHYLLASELGVQNEKMNGAMLDEPEQLAVIAQPRVPVDLLPDEDASEEEEPESDPNPVTALPASKRPANYYRFTIGRSAFKIRSGEFFEAVIRWAEPLQLAAPIYSQLILHGLTWRPLS